MTDTLVAADALTKTYRLPRQSLLAPAGQVQALAGVSFCVMQGSNLGIVGQSGSGKSTLARLVMGLEWPDSGRVKVLGHDLAALAAPELRTLRKQFQMVFQDPYGSLDPRMRVGRIVGEPLPGATPIQVREALEAVALRAGDADKYPHEFSGGQRQRIAIARALITRPRLIVADEPVSALDVSVQAQVLNLFADLQVAFGLTYLFISHDLPVVAQVCQQVAVLYRGRIVEQGQTSTVFSQPAHPYTQSLVAAVPDFTAPKRGVIQVSPLPAHVAAACPYAGACAQRQPVCLAEAPQLRNLQRGGKVACHFPAVLPGAL